MSREDVPFARTMNGGVLALDSIPSFDADSFARTLRDLLADGLRLCAYFAAAPRAASRAPSRTASRGAQAARAAAKPGAASGGGAELFAVLADDEGGCLYVGRAALDSDSFPSIAQDFPQAQLFEREIAEQFGLRPEGHPWLKPVRYASPIAAAGEAASRGAAVLAPGTGDFYRVEGEEVHEVAVGPVHAGVIEPGHFRFQCHGERVFHLEIALGYQHRGVEEALIGGPDKRSLHYVENASGDSAVAHAGAYCAALEALSRSRRPARAHAIGAIALELERLACHVGDLGAISGDVGFLPTASYCGRIRGDFLNMTALICGNRFGRNLMAPGGLRYDLEEPRAAELARRVRTGYKEAKNAIDLLWENQSVMARLEDTGRVGREEAIELGAVGPAARASGLARDARFNHSWGIYRMSHIPVSTYDSGDVLGRAFVRHMEIQHSVSFILEQLKALPSGELYNEGAKGASLAPDSLAVALSEGWRGEVCHVAITDGKGAFARYKIVDPSFHNWPVLARSLRDQEISDFPLCNKSFNLSYCGHDL